MRQLTDFEKEQITQAFDADANPTQAVTFEFQYFMRQNKTINGITRTHTKNYIWEEMPIVATYSGGNLFVNKVYVDNPLFFTSSDSPSPEVTGKSGNLIDIANETLYANPETDMIVGFDTTRIQHYQRTVIPEPGLIWARRIKVYTFDADTGAITDISYYVWKEVQGTGQDWPYTGGTAAFGQGVVQVGTSGNNYVFPLFDQTANRSTSIYMTLGSYSNATLVAADSVWVQEEDGEAEVHLLGNASEALYYQKKVTLTGGIFYNDAYADRQQARENLATALWG